jgi:hypothetical protein
VKQLQESRSSFVDALDIETAEMKTTRKTRYALASRLDISYSSKDGMARLSSSSGQRNRNK